MSTAEKKIIESSSKVFFSGTVLSRLSGLLRDIFTAYAFGSSSAIAALMVAFRFSSLLRRLFGEGALHAAFVPAYEKIRLESKQKAGEFFIQLSLLLALMLLIIIGVSELGLGSLLSWGALSASSHQIVFLTMVLLPTLVFICSSAFCGSLLQCHNYFFIPSVSPAIFNLFWILGVFFLRKIPIDQAVFNLALWIIAGVFFQWILMLPQSLNLVKEFFSISLITSYQRLKGSFQIVAKPLALGIVGVSTTQINSALDSIFARYISLEGPAYLWYAIRIQQVPLALFGIAMAGAILAPLARAYNRGENDFLDLFIYSLSRAMGLLVPCFVALMVLGPFCVSLLYGRGNFTLFAAEQTTYSLWAYSLGLIPQGLILIFAPFFYVKGKYYRTTRASIISLLLNVVLNSFFAFVLKMPAWGVALATAISSWVQVFYLSYFCFKSYSLKRFESFFKTSFEVLTGTLMSALLSYFVIVYFNPFITEKTLLYFPRNFHVQVMCFSLGTSIFLGFLFLIAYLFKLQEILALLQYLPFVKRRY